MHTEILSKKNIYKLLDKAVKLQNNGNLQQAEIIYLQILKQQPDNFDAVNNMAILAYNIKNYTAAIAYSSKALQINPENAMPIGNLGLVFSDMNQLDKAVICFEKAISLSPQNAMFHYNLARALFKQKKYDESLAASNIAFAYAPENGDIFNNLAVVYFERGDFALANELFAKSLKCSNYITEKVYNTVNCLFALGNYKKLHEFVAAIKQQSSLSEITMAGLYITEAIIYLQNEELDSCKLVLNKIGILQLPKDHIPFPQYIGLQLYYLYIQRLYDFYQNHQYLYKNQYDANLYIIGDSHCLSPAFTCAKIGSINYKCIPHLIIGAQARHLTLLGNNKFTAMVDIRMQSVPANSTIVLMFGEIDTRIEFGILPYHKKINKLNEKSINISIKNIVSNYIDFCIQKCKIKQLKLILYGIPADNINIALEPADKAWRRYIIKEFNAELSRITRKKKIPFIDIYKLTVANGGDALDKYYLEGIHLQPVAFSEACKYMKI